MQTVQIELDHEQQYSPSFKGPDGKRIVRGRPYRKFYKVVSGKREVAALLGLPEDFGYLSGNQVKKVLAHYGEKKTVSVRRHATVREVEDLASGPAGQRAVDQDAGTLP